MLSEFEVHPSLAASDLGRAKTWYAERLGLEPRREWDGLLLYGLGSSVFTVYETPSAGTARNTVAIWNVADLQAEVARLRQSGVVFEDYDFGDERTIDGILRSDDGTLNAWFADSEGNILSIVQIAGDSRETAISAMLAAADLARARTWYADKLGLALGEEHEGLLIYTSGRSRMSVYETPSAGTARNTVAVWRVTDLRAEMATLRARGVVFEDYDFGDARTVGGVLTDDDGSLNAWFTDSEGNVLGIVEDHDEALA